MVQAALDQSIAVFQQAHRLRPSGRINRLGSDVDRLESALPAGHRRMSGVPGTVLVRRRNTAAPAPVTEAAARTEATAPLPDFERAALAELQRALAEAHKLCFTVTGLGVVSGGRFQVSLACPDSEWLDLRRNVFELGGKLPAALRRGLEGTIRGAARAWKIAPASGDRPGLVLASTRAFPALHPDAAPKGAGLDALAIAQTPSEPTARACLAACLDLIQSGETQTPAGRKLFDALAEAVGVMHPQMARALAQGLQLAQATGPSPHSQRVWANPTGGSMRGSDRHGSGKFRAPRTNVYGFHRGVDYVATSGQSVVAVTAGEVTKIGFPYKANYTIKYVEITSPLGYVVREYYVDPLTSIRVGSNVATGQPIGTHQSLSTRYPGITEHVHVEIMLGGALIDPTTVIP